MVENKAQDFIQWKVFDSFELLTELDTEWDQFVLSVDGHIYMSYDWCRLWWEYYGRGSYLRVFIFWASGNLIGILPFCIDILRLGVLNIKIARVLGSNIPPKLSDLPVSPEWAESIFKITMSELTVAYRCDAIIIGPLSNEYSGLASLRMAATDLSHLVTIKKCDKASEYTEFLLPESQDDYFQSLSKKERDKCRYELRLLQKTFEYKMDVLKGGDEIKNEFPIFRKLHDKQWQSQGFLGHFLAWPKSEEFNTSVCIAQGRLNRSRLFRITANGEPISYQYSFKFGDRYYWRLPAREVGSEWTRFSLGRVGFLTMVTYAMEEGVRKIEAGLGSYTYKQQLGARELMANNIILLAKRKDSILRFNIFLLYSKIFDVMYQKIWIRRVAPRLRLKRRPLSIKWIRSKLL